MRGKLTVGAEGLISVPPSLAETLGLASGGDVHVVSARGAFALLVPEGADAPRAYFAGSLASLTIAEVVQFVLSSLKTGTLLLGFGGEAEREVRPDDPARLRRKSIFFKEGQVVFASSTDPADRLGPVLLRTGVVGQADLERCSRLVGASRPLGQVLVDEGMVTPGQLYEAITVQVKEIFLSTFTETSGEFAFLEGDPDEANQVKLPERTRDLVLEGLKRLEETEQRQASDSVPSSAEVEAPVVIPPPLQGKKPRVRPPGPEQRHASDSVASPPEVEVEVEAPVVTPPPLQGKKPRARPPGPAGPFETYRRIFKRVTAAIAGVEPRATERLNSWFDRLPETRRGVFEGVRIGDDGDMDVAQVLVNVESAGTHQGAAARARSLEALEEFLAFALFEAKNRLSRGDADKLLREVGRMQVGKA